MESRMQKNDPTTLLFDLLREALWHTAGASLCLASYDAAEWERLFRLAVRQGVAAVVWEVVERLPAELQPPRALRLRWAFETGRIERRWQRQRRCVARLAAFYARHGIRMMLLKGYGLSLCYPVPEHRPCGDVDIWLFGRQAEADVLITREWGIAVDTGKEHHTTFRLDDIPVENHYDFLDTFTHASNRRLELLLKRLAARPVASVPVADTRVYLPSATFQALFLLRHAAGHFAACGIGVRHLVDWTLFVARSHDRIDWPLVERAVRESGMETFTQCFRALCVEHLGLDETWMPPLRRNRPLERRMLQALLNISLSPDIPANRLHGIWFRLRRWWSFRWMRRMVYDEGLAKSFLRMSWSHLRRHLPPLRNREEADRIRRATRI